ncbi:type IV secretion system protein [Sinorhizobium saheli]|uniref:Type IV secretion system protein VirB6 n=2 Tax=Sinorhizobium saheli TaxID=36856 RepID=A0A178XY43_SINSA|nr:type IV secretion system protein [Sinorhizobium saheli]MQW86661.1 type IV secretion system protein [Sinorhizobium saheli]OAP40161.1 type IV secretion system protein VirB6 [Sinorhizobium saheli]
MKFGIAAPFTAIHTTFDLAFEIGLKTILEQIQSAVSAPLVACVTLWIIVQGILVMRGEIDMRGGVTRVMTVSLVVSLVVGQANYHDYVVSVFEDTIPSFVHQVSGSNIPFLDIPARLDIIFAQSQYYFQKIASEIGPMNGQDILAFEGAQWVFYGSLWAAFAIYDSAGILMKVLLAIGPLMLVGYLFDRTRDMAAKWVGQLVTYGILFLLLNIVTTIVIATEAAALAVMLRVISFSGTTGAKIIGLYELDMFFLTGDALIVALPVIAGNIGGAYLGGTHQIGSSLNRHLARLTRG